MKKFVLALLIVLIVIASPAYAERYWGAKLGFNSGTFTGDDADAADWGAEERSGRGAFVGGAFLDYRVNDLIGVRPEILFSGKGAVYEGDDWDITIKLGTVELPILGQIFLPIPTDVVDVALYAGPAPAAIYSSKYEYSEPGYDEEGDTEDVGVEVITFDLAVTAGVGLFVPAGPGEVVFDLRYTAGLLSVVEDLDVTGSIADPILRTSTVGVTVGYGFPF